MKKHYLLIVATAFSMVAINTSAQSKSSSAPLTKVNAGKIIEMTNGVVDIYNDQISEIKDVRECIDRFEKTMATVAENPKLTAHGAACNNIRVLRNDLLEKMQAKAKLAPAFPEKAEILSSVDKLNAEFAISKERCHNVQNYFKEKRYQTDDDNFAGYVALRDTFIASYKKINLLFDKTMDLSSAAGDRAELVVLKTHPLASVVIPMKKNLSAVSQIMSKCRADEPDAAAIKAEVAAVRKSLEKDKVMTPALKTALKKSSNGEYHFNHFYEYADEAMNKADNFLEYLDPAKEIKDVDHVLKETVEEARDRHLRKHYNEISDYYGYMVDEYNRL